MRILSPNRDELIAVIYNSYVRICAHNFFRMTIGGYFVRIAVCDDEAKERERFLQALGTWNQNLTAKP